MDIRDIKVVDNKNQNEIIDFYVQNGLEFSDKNSFFGTCVKSFVLYEYNKIIGAISFSIYKNSNFIEALAIDKEYRNKGYGSYLLNRVIEEIEKPIYTISKVDKFYLKNEFKYDDRDLISLNCKKCREYNINCFPKVMVFN